MTSNYDEPRAHHIREQYHSVFGGDELPVPVHAIAEDLLGLAVEERNWTAQRAPLPGDRRIVLNADESAERRRLHACARARSLGLPVPRGDASAGLCRVEEVGVDPQAKALEREANIFAANLVMPERIIRRSYLTGETAQFGVSEEALA